MRRHPDGSRLALQSLLRFSPTRRMWLAILRRTGTIRRMSSFLENRWITARCTRSPTGRAEGTAFSVMAAQGSRPRPGTQLTIGWTQCLRQEALSDTKRAQIDPSASFSFYLENMD